MSTDYLPSKAIEFERLRELVGEVHVTENTLADANKICLTDGVNYIWAYKSFNGNSTFTRYAGNSAENILTRLANIFDIEFISEYEEEEFGRLASDYHDHTLITAAGSEKVKVPAYIYSWSVGDGANPKTEKPTLDEYHTRCVAVIHEALRGKKEVEKLTSEEQCLLSYILSKLVLHFNMEYQHLTPDELRELKILLSRSDGRELNPPLSQKEYQEVSYLLMLARSPDGKVTKARLNSEEWQYLGLLLARQKQFEFSVDGVYLNNGDWWCIFTILNRVCKVLETFMPGDNADEEKIVNAIFASEKIASEHFCLPKLEFCKDGIIKRVDVPWGVERSDG